MVEDTTHVRVFSRRMASIGLPSQFRFLLFLFVIRFLSIFWGPHHFSSSSYDFISLSDYERHLRLSVRNNCSLQFCPSLPKKQQDKHLKLSGKFWTSQDVGELDERLLSQTLRVQLGGSWSTLSSFDKI